MAICPAAATGIPELGSAGAAGLSSLADQIVSGTHTSQGFDAEPELLGVAIEGLLFGRTSQLNQLFGTEDRLVDPARSEPLADQFDRIAHRNDHENLHRLGKQWSPDDHVRLEFMHKHDADGDG
jgi:hypothetical protein